MNKPKAKTQNLSAGQKLAKENKQLFRDMLMYRALHPEIFAIITGVPGNSNLNVIELGEAQLIALAMIVVQQYFKRN